MEERWWWEQSHEEWGRRFVHSRSGYGMLTNHNKAVFIRISTGESGSDKSKVVVDVSSLYFCIAEEGGNTFCGMVALCHEALAAATDGNTPEATLKCAKIIGGTKNKDTGRKTSRGNESGTTGGGSTGQGRGGDASSGSNRGSRHLKTSKGQSRGSNTEKPTSGSLSNTRPATSSSEIAFNERGVNWWSRTKDAVLVCTGDIPPLLRRGAVILG